MSILFVAMKPFSFRADKSLVRRLMLLAYIFFTFLLSGCGGFSSEAPSQSEDDTPVLFFQGQVNFPGGVNGSYQRIDRSSSVTRTGIQASIQNAQGVIGATLGLYKASDLFFKKNLLKAGTTIQTNAEGMFSITKDQITPDALQLEKEVFIIRASFNNFDLTSLVSVASKNEPVIDSIEVNIVSDGAIRFLREEILQKVGGVTEAQDFSAELWNKNLENLTVELSDRRSEIQQKFNLTEFDRNDYLISSNLENRNAGQNWAKEIDRLSYLEKDWSLIATAREELRLSALTAQMLPQSPLALIIQVRRRSLQLLYTFLEYGFAVSNGNGRILVKDDWIELENGIAPSFKSDLNAATLRLHFDELISDEDLSIFPIPSGLIEFNIAELSTYAQSGLNAAEKKTLIAQDLFRRPWITKNILQAIAQLDLKDFVSIRDLMNFCADVFIQQRPSIERVQDQQVSGGLAFFGELVDIPEEFGGQHPSSEFFQKIWSEFTLNNAFESSFEDLLGREEIYFSMLRDVYLAEYHRLVERSQKITMPNNGYPDPVSVNATRNLIFRKSSGQYVTRTPRVSRSINLIERIYESVFRMAENTLQGPKINLDSKRSLSQLIPWFALLLSHSFPLQEELGFYKDISGVLSGKNPRFENFRVLRFDPVSVNQLWTNLITESGQQINLVTDTALVDLTKSLNAMARTTIPWLSVAKSDGTSIVASGHLFLKNSYPKSPIAANFPVRAVIQSTNSQEILTFTAQSNGVGVYQFDEFPLKADQLYHFEFVVKDSEGSASPTVVLSYAYYVAGFEQTVDLPDFFMESQFAVRASNYSGDLNTIEPENFAPQIQIVPFPDVTSGIIPISVIVTDPESQPVDIQFKFTSGFDLTITTAAPRVSVSSDPSATFPLDGFINGIGSSKAGIRTTFYWHSQKESGPIGFLGSSSIDNLRFELSAFESGNRIIRGNTVFSNFFNLDNESPTISFDAPLKDLRINGAQDSPESVLKNITLKGKAFDSSRITRLFVRNRSLNPTDLRTYSAVNTGDNFGTWRIDMVPLELGVTNFFEFFAQDIHGNINSQAVTASIISLDSVPPDLEVRTITIFSIRNVPQIISTIPIVPFTVSTSMVTEDKANAIQLTLETTSTGLMLDTITTNRIRFEGYARDVNGVSLVKLNGLTILPSTTDGLNYVWSKEITLPESGLSSLIFSAIDKKNNNSGSTSPSDSEKRLSAVKLQISTIDYSGPEVAITNLEEGRLPQTVTTDLIEISGVATDRSIITSFELCSNISCVAVSSTDHFLNWKAFLPLQEASTNIISGFIEDQYGFRETFSTATSSLVTLFLNDITPPSMTVTSVENIPDFLPLRVDQNFDEPPRPSASFISVNDCLLTSCSIGFSGFVSDDSGILLTKNSENDFSGFKLRMNDLSNFDLNSEQTSLEDLWGVTGSLLPNGSNFTKITTVSSVSNGKVETLVYFNAQVILQDDGYWPLQLSLSDNSNNQFGFYSRPTILKREVFYFKKDTTGPSISDLNVTNGDIADGGLLKITGRINDELSAIDRISANGIMASTMISATINSPWARFIALDAYSSVTFEILMTIPAGIDRELKIEAEDAFGNLSTLTRSITVLPVFSNRIELQEQFSKPSKLAFSGNFFDQVMVGDASNNDITELSLNAVSINVFKGNQDLDQDFYNQLSIFEDLDYFVDPVSKDERMVVVGKFSGEKQEGKNFEIIRLEKEKDSNFLRGKFKSEATAVPGFAYHLFRENESASTSDIFTTGTLVKFTPLLESVVYVYRPTSANIPQLIRYVNGFSNPAQVLLASQGGAVRSTGIRGNSASNSAPDFVVSTSQVKAIVVTQVHVTGASNGAQGVDESVEYIYLADAEFKRITRFKNINLPLSDGGGFSALPSISLTSVVGPEVDPVALEIESDGTIAYIANATDMRVYKLDISGVTPSLIVSFGGAGFFDGQFENISHLKGRKFPEEANFSEIYIADPVSQRISIFTTDGQFIRYFGINPYGLGGMRKPQLLGAANDELFVVDTELQTVDFYSSEDDPIHRETLNSLAITASFDSSLTLLYAPLTGFQDLSKYNDPNDQSSEELFRTQTQEIFYLKSPNQLRQLIHSESYFFTAQKTDEGRFLVETHQIATPIERVFTRGRLPFENLVDMELVLDDSANRIFTLENNNGISRVQIIPFYETSPASNFDILDSTTNLQQTSAVGICAYTSGVVVVGANPANRIDVAPFSGNIKDFNNNWNFEQRNLKSFDGLTNLSLEQPNAVDCKDTRLAIADKHRVLIFDFAKSSSQGLNLVQEIISADPEIASVDPLSVLSGPLEVQFFENYLYVLETDRSRLLKYKLQ